MRKRVIALVVLMAMVIVLQFVGSMIPPIGGTVSISLVLIPIIVGAAIYGPGAGAILGATFAQAIGIEKDFAINYILLLNKKSSYFHNYAFLKF